MSTVTVSESHEKTARELEQMFGWEGLLSSRGLRVRS